MFLCNTLLEKTHHEQTKISGIFKDARDLKQEAGDSWV
jgi:hypothetical protein